jgi:signal transduction histidine kinase
MVAKSKTLKSYFIRVILLSSLIPFFVSVSLLWNFISNSNEKINLANNQLKRSYDLEIIDSFHKIQSSANIVAQSEELKSYFDSTIDTESKNHEDLYKVISLVKKSLLYKNIKWIVISTRGKVIVSIPSEILIENIIKNREQEIGVHLNLLKDVIKFIIPISYKLTADSKGVKKNLGYIILLLPISDVKNIFPDLMSIESISKNLDIKDFRTKIKIEYQKENNLAFLYLYIFISFFFICIATFWGLKIFQSKIVDKILFLRVRVRNEMEYLEKKELKNELDSLSQTFDLYLRYTRFLQREIFKSSQLAAAGNIAHVIAHDVRKPFSRLRFFMDEIKNFIHIKDVHASVKDFEPSFVTSIEYIEHILSEVMDAGITKLNISQGVGLEKILVKSFQNLSSISGECEINIEYNLASNLILLVDELRVTRIIVNIISNAFEAMGYNGKIWIHSKEVLFQDGQFIEICIGNNNSYISHEDIEHIFEPFFTQKKDQGTGLGLSIAQKIVSLHGGKIECRSSLKMGVEFIFTLPAKIEKYNQTNSELPKIIYGSKLKENIKDTFIQNGDSKDKKFVVIIDDDPLICRSWKRNLSGVGVITFLQPEEFQAFLEKNKNFINKIDIIVSDYYFGKNSKFTFDKFARELREIYNGKVFLSSDVILNEDLILKELNIILLEKRVYSYKELLEK